MRDSIGLRVFCYTLGVVMLSLFLASSTARAEYQETIRKSFKVKEGGTLRIHSVLGSIEVTAGESNRVEVEISQTVKRMSEKKAREFLKDFEINFDQQGNLVEISADYLKNKWNFWDKVGRYLRLHYRIKVPRKFNLDLNTAGGSIKVDNLEGEVQTKTSGGSLKFGRIKGPVYGKTSGGSITLEECSGTAEVKTSGGYIHLGKVEGNVSASTSGGSIRIEEARGTVSARTSGGSVTVNEVMGTIQAFTSGGSITAHITKQPQSDCRLTTSGGSIKVYMNSDLKMNINAHTSGGSVTADFPITIQGKLRSNALQGKINGGGPELYLRTSGGSIYLKQN